jgi:hypothetical protein
MTFKPDLILSGSITGMVPRSYVTPLSTSSAFTAQHINNYQILSQSANLNQIQNLITSYISNSGSGDFTKSNTGQYILLGSSNTNNTGSSINLTGHTVILNRGYADDINANTASFTNVMLGFSNNINHLSNTNANIYTSQIINNRALNQILSGVVNEIFSYAANNLVGRASTSKGVNVSSIYGFRNTIDIGWTSGLGGAVTSSYGVYLDAPIVRATGTLINNWGLYAPDPSMKHHISGSVSIGTVQTGSYKLHVVGDTGISGSLVVTGSVVSTQGFTGSLFGTSSWAISASWAPIQTTVATASFISSSNVFGPYGFDSIQTSSYVSGSSAIVTNLTSSTDILIVNSTSSPISIGRGLYTGSNNLFFGYRALPSIGIETAFRNIAIGDFALSASISGSENVAVGYGALRYAENNRNTAVGAYALFYTTGSTGFRNNAFGAYSLAFNTTGEVNNAFGSYALYRNTVDDYNAAFADFALYNLSTGSSNAAVGQAAGFNLISGEGNVIIGRGAAPSLLSGSNNTIIGGITPNADINTPVFGLSTGSFNTIIGSNIKGLPSTLNSNIIIANGLGIIRAQHDATNWTLSGSLLPTLTDTFDLGSSSNRWKDLYLSGSTIYLGNIELKEQAGNFVAVSGSGGVGFSGSFTGSLFGTASYAANIYNSDGELEGNRVIGSGSNYTLTLAPTLIFKNSVTELNRKSTFNELNNTTGSTSASLSVYGNINSVSESFKIINGISNTINAVYDFDGGLFASNGVNTNINLVGKQLTSRIGGQAGLFSVTRGGFSGSNDISENGFNTLTGLRSGVFINGGPYTSTSSFTATANGIIVNSNVFNGRVTSLYGIRVLDSVSSVSGSSIVSSSVLTNYYGIRLSNSVGTTSGGPSASIDNYYSIRIDSPTLGVTGRILNLYGIHAPGSTMNHYFAGNISIGTTETGSYKLHLVGNAGITGSVVSTEGFTGSLQGTASWATNTLTASSADDFLVRGTLTAQTIVAQTITSSTDFVTGSTRFGTLTSNTHQFTGSVTISGSLNVNGPATINNLTGSLFGTASWAENSLTASFVLNAISASYVSGSGAVVTDLTSSNDASINSTTVGRGGGNILTNTVLGNIALQSNTTGVQNTAIGYNSQNKNTTGTRNTALGGNSLSNNTTGQYNVALGVGALLNPVDGDYNIGLGYVAASSFRTGSRNIFVGAAINSTQPGIETGSFNTIIGTGISGLSSTLNNNIILADGQGNIKAWHNATSWSFFNPVVAPQGFTGSLLGTASTGSTLEGIPAAGFVTNVNDTYTGTGKITDIITLTQAEYDGIGSPSVNSLYIII